MRTVIVVDNVEPPPHWYLCGTGRIGRPSPLGSGCVCLIGRRWSVSALPGYPRSCHNIPLMLFVHVCVFSLGKRGAGGREENVGMLGAHLGELLLTAMIINEPQASTAVTSKKLCPLNGNKRTNIPAGDSAEPSAYRHYPPPIGEKAKRLAQSTSPVALGSTSNYYTPPACLSINRARSSPLLVSPFSSLPSPLLLQLLFFPSLIATPPTSVSSSTPPPLVLQLLTSSPPFFASGLDGDRSHA